MVSHRLILDLVAVCFVALSLVLAGCAGDLDDATDTHAETLEQAIVNGTTEPLITNLTSGEQLAIGFVADTSGEPFCSGTLIADDVVVTARHCLEDREVEDMRFGIGQPDARRALIAARRVSQSDWELDVALIQLKLGATGAVPEVVPLPLNREPLDESLVGTQVETAGYHPISGVSRRRFAVLEVTGVFETFTKAEGFGERGACQGDSGGPLLLHTDTGEPVVAGTIIGGHISCLEHSYFSRVDVVADWIDEELAWFASSDQSTGGGSSQGERRIPDPCVCSPTQRVPQTWTTLATLLGVLVLTRRWRRDAAAS